MCYKKILLLTAFSAALAACNKKITVDTPSGLTIAVNNERSAVADTLYYNLGDTVKFLVSGYADNVVFYSGESTHNYLYANRDTADGVPEMYFTSNLTGGSTQTNTLHVLATDKFNWIFTSDTTYTKSVLTGEDSTFTVTNTTQLLTPVSNYTDITARFRLSTGSGAIGSDTADLSDLVNGPDDSLVIGFYYTGLTGSVQPTWAITNLNVINALADSTPDALLSVSSSASINGIGYSSYWLTPSLTGVPTNPAVKWVSSATQLSLTGGVAANPSNDQFIVSAPIHVNYVKPDAPVVIKSVGSPTPVYTIAGITYDGYNYQYAKRGLYQGTFVNSNTSIDQNKQLVKQFWIRVQ